MSETKLLLEVRMEARLLEAGLLERLLLGAGFLANC